MKLSPPVTVVICTILCFHLTTACTKTPSRAKYIAPSTEECWEQTGVQYSTTPASSGSELAQAISEYRELVRLSYSSRRAAITLLTSLKQSIADHQPLHGHDLDQLNQGMIFLFELRSELYNIAYFHKCWVNAEDDEFTAANLGHLSKKERLTGIMLSLSASLLLYDNYLLLVSAYAEDSKLRYFLNQRDSGYNIRSRELNRVTTSYNSLSQRRAVRAAMQMYEKAIATTPTMQLYGEDFLYLQDLIEQSPSYQMTRHPSLFGAIGREIQFMEAVSYDSLHSLTDQGISLFSTLFGNAVGLIQFRRGKLFQHPEVEKNIATKLRSGDILLEKTPFRLTDQFIPGHWGHAAIWIGTEKELTALGIWDHPVVVPYQDAIRKGHGIVEALRNGVQLNTLQHFLNIDDFAAIRNPKISNTQMAERIILALRQVGKGYDYNFNVETTNKIVCSELIYTVYIDMDWPTQQTLGRHTISPDQVALMALGESPLKIVVFFHDGQQVTDKSHELFAQLVK
jgi:uncharacterized protein YycO